MTLSMRFLAFQNEPQNAACAGDAFAWRMRSQGYEVSPARLMSHLDNGANATCGKQILGAV